MAQNRKSAKGKAKSAAVVSSTKESKRGFYAVLGLAAAAGIGVLAYLSVTGNKPIVLDPNLPPVTSEGYVMGSATAPLEIVEFGDFECPGCGQFAELTEPDLRAQYVNTGKVRFRYIDFPLVGAHPNSLSASTAAACADEQGKFWEMHDLIYATQYQWNSQATSSPDKIFKDLARRIQGLDGAKFDECHDSRRMLPKVQSHLKIATDRGVNRTPTFVIGNRQYESMSMDDFRRVLDQELAAIEAAKAGPKKP